MGVAPEDDNSRDRGRGGVGGREGAEEREAGFGEAADEDGELIWAEIVGFWAGSRVADGGGKAERGGKR